MPSRLFGGRILAAAAIAGAAACSHGEVAPTGSSAGPAAPASTARPEPARPPRTLSIPGDAGGLPQGHPPIDTAPAGMGWDAPAGWIAETPSSSMRIAQYRVPGPAGDGECVAFYFGPGQGGDPRSNALRWAGQFTQPDGRPSVDAMRTEALAGTPRPVQIVELTGTYDGGMTMTDAPAVARPGYMLLGGIADGPDAPWFFKFTGPEATVRAQREAFIGMLRSLRTGA